MKEKLEFKLLGTGVIVLVAAVLAINVFVYRIEKEDIYSLSADRLAATAKVVTKGIERTMVEGKADVTRSFVGDLSNISGFQSIEVFNKEGRPAFSPGSKIVEAESLKTIASTGKHITTMNRQSIVYYMPLENLPTCRQCHPDEGSVLGAVKLAISLEGEYEKITDFIVFLTMGSLLGLGVMGLVFWQILRKFVILPLKGIESSASKMAEGDLTFPVEIKTNDEIGRLSDSIRKSLLSISDILRRVREVSGRISAAADSVEAESAMVVKSTQLEAEAASEISSTMEQLNSAIGEISDSIEALADSVEETAASIEEMTSTIGSLTKMTHDVSEGVEATSSSIEQLSATIKEVASNAKELEKVSEEMLSSVDEIITSVKEVESGARESASLSEKVKEQASTLGVSSINKTMEGMENIRSSVDRTSSAIGKLVSRSEEIGKVLNVIDEIADQTTLLALNAAILAAQAGEHGKGFSVVANEIKDLAERTALSTREIDQLVNGIRQDVKDAVSAMKGGMASVEEGMVLSREASAALREILNSATKSSEMSMTIARTTTEQATSANYVSESVERLRAMVEQIAKATAEQSRGVTLIIDAAEKIRDASQQADKATVQQAIGSRQVVASIESITERSQQISRAIREQRTGSAQITKSLEKIKKIPEENRSLAFGINREIKGLVKDSVLVMMEMERFRLFEDKAADTVRFGVVPFMDPADIFRKLSPLASYLGRELGKRFDLKVGKDYKSALEDLKEGGTQLCLMTSVMFVEALEDKGIKVLVESLRQGKPRNRSAIIVRDGDKINSVGDLKFKSFAFVDPHSASGHIVPRAMLLEEGVGVSELSFYNFLGTHDDVAEAVLRGEFDAGGVLDITAEKFASRGIKVLKYSMEIPGFNICSSVALGESDREAVKSALLKLNDKNPATASVLAQIRESCSGFRTADETDYAGIKAMLSRTGLP